MTSPTSIAPTDSPVQATPRRILFVATSYPRDGDDWRGVFIRALAFALARRTDVRVAVWAPPGELPPAAAAATTPDDDRWLGALMQAGGIAHRVRAGGAGAVLAPLVLLRRLHRAYRRASADAYFVNWLQCALPLPRDGKPLLLTALGSDMRLLRVPIVTAWLRRAMRHRPVAICPNADWMEAPLRERFGDVATVRTVPFGIDDRWFAVRRPPRDGTVPRWLAVTRLTADKLGPLLEWGAALFADGRRELHLIGPMQDDLSLPDWVHWHGAATPAALAGHWFPSATGLVTLSRHAEGRPQVMLEAMAAGLPIVASRSPAHADVVAHDRTGLLCEDPAGFAAALARVEMPGVADAYGEAARREVRAVCGTWDDCVARHLAALDDAIAGVRQ